MAFHCFSCVWIVFYYIFNLFRCCPIAVSRPQVSAPPGFSAPNRLPPPGFSSHDRVGLSSDTATGIYFLFVFWSNLEAADATV